MQPKYFFHLVTCAMLCMYVFMGSAVIVAGGYDPHFGKVGRGGHNFGIIQISHTALNTDLH